jgi:DNA repair protein RecO (recombination protein O)
VERYADLAVVLGSVDYGDADRLVTLFTRDHGKLTAFAGGARKSKRRFAGALEPCTVITAQLVERHGSTVRIDSADIQSAFPRLRQDLALIARGLYCIELCRELTRDREPHEQMFAQLVAYLTELDAGRAGPTSLIAFELSALAEAGLMPRLDQCAICNGVVGENARFDPDHGGVVCANCLPRARGVPVSEKVVTSLRELQRGARTPMPPDQRRKARELLNLFIDHQLGRRLKSVEFMEQVGVD